MGSCLQCRGASAIWFVNHWWHLTSSTLIFGHVGRLDSGVPAYDALRLMVDTYEGKKPMATVPPSQRLAQQGSGGCQRSTAIYAVEIWDRQGSRRSTTVHLDCATTAMMMLIADLIIIETKNLAAFFLPWGLSVRSVRIVSVSRAERGQISSQHLAGWPASSNHWLQNAGWHLAAARYQCQQH